MTKKAKDSKKAERAAYELGQKMRDAPVRRFRYLPETGLVLRTSVKDETPLFNTEEEAEAFGRGYEGRPFEPKISI